MITTQDSLALLRENHQAMKGLVSTINATGGLISDPGKTPTNLVPAGDPDWLDVANCTLKAFNQCRKIEKLLDDAGHPLPEKDLCPKIEIPNQD